MSNYAQIAASITSQMVTLCARHPADQSSTPMGSGFLAGGGAVYLRVAKKKSPRLPHVQSIVGVRPFSRVTDHYVWVGQGFGDFLDLREKVFFLV